MGREIVPRGAKSYISPDLHHFYSEGTFLEVLNIGKVRFSKNWLLVPIWPTKAYFLPNFHHFHSEGTFLQVINNGKVKLSKNWILVPIWPP